MDKGLISGATTTLILKLLEEKDRYGYEMIETLKERSDHTFDLKAGTLYPILHQLEKQGCVESYEQAAGKERVRKYYHLTDKGAALLKEKQAELKVYFQAVNRALDGRLTYAGI